MLRRAFGRGIYHQMLGIPWDPTSGTIRTAQAERVGAIVPQFAQISIGIPRSTCLRDLLASRTTIELQRRHLPRYAGIQ
jgi:hypothetical protein